MIDAPLTARLRTNPPLIHGGRQFYFGLGWPALDWLERHVTADMTTIETGCGGSTVIFAAAGARHTVITPAAEEYSALEAYCAGEGISTERVRLLAESSHTALTQTWSPEPLDVVLIDGAHAFPFPALDWFLTAMHLKLGGHVLLDDAHLPSVHMVYRFLRQSEAWAYEGALGYRTACFRKTTDDVAMDATITAFDRRPRFGHLPPAKRPAAWARHVVDRSPALQRRLGVGQKPRTSGPRRATPD